MQRIHFIAIGGSAMHNLAIALHQKGAEVTGSDDEIFEPSRSRLQHRELLPERMGWHPVNITKDLDAVILGMHARKDNPELLRAQELGVPIFSYPEFIYEQTKGKTRIVIGGSHGKTTITSMIIHVLRQAGVELDYLVGAQLQGFDCMVRLSDTSQVAVLEGDEYLSSPIDRRPKFHLYKPDIALISGIAWDHINVFPTFRNYVEQFEEFINCIEPGGKLIYCEADVEVKKIAMGMKGDSVAIPYNTPPHVIRDGITFLKTGDREIPLRIFGRHNLQNLEGARHVCHTLGIGDREFYSSISEFMGASKRLEELTRTKDRIVFKDFAHSPSKLKATLNAVREQFPEHELVACMELHTFSSMNSDFMEQYAGAMDAADRAIVYFDPHAVEMKRLDPIDPAQVKASFAREDVQVLTDPVEVMGQLRTAVKKKAVLLLMSSGNFGGSDVSALAEAFIA